MLEDWGTRFKDVVKGCKMHETANEYVFNDALREEKLKSVMAKRRQLEESEQARPVHAPHATHTSTQALRRNRVHA